IEIMKPDGRDILVTVKQILNEDGEPQESAPHPQQILYVDLEGKAEKYDILRREEV
ncbi:MAG TPA: peptidase U32, partial [Lachnospiraceae bacterium]|nr:peptidase U32 [Lachnospiraceae bacterium]